jgi:hypothetical protein
MRGSIRLAITACAALATLAFAGSAWAVYSPLLTVTSISNKPGKPTTMFLGHFQNTTDDATAKDTIYVPLGYQMNLAQTVGSKIGKFSGGAILRSGGNTQPEFLGDLVVDSPANYPPATNTCTPGQTHEAVWRIDFTLAGTPQSVAVYVDRITVGPEALFASAKLQFCLQGPVGTTSGAQVLFLLLDVQGVFTSPPNTSPRIWHATFTPYFPDTATWNEAGTTEGQAVSPGKVKLTLTVKRLKHGVVLLRGRLLADGKPFSGALMELYMPGKLSPVGKGRTNSNGGFTIRKRLKKKARFYALTVPVKALPSCPGPPIGAPLGCTTATESFVASTGIVVAKPRR